MGFFKNLFNKKQEDVVEIVAQEEVNVTPAVIETEAPFVVEAKTPLVEITADQAKQLEEFKALHKAECGMETYQIVIAHKDGKWGQTVR